MKRTPEQIWAEMSKLPETERDPYFALPAISNSFLGTYWRTSLSIPEPNFRHAIRIGHGVHQLVLEPEKFDAMSHTGAERVRYMGMARAIREQSSVPIDSTQDHERLYNFVKSGLRAKAKLDIVDENRGFIADIKTTACTTRREFEQSIYKYQYQRQGYFYLDIPEVEKAGCHTVHFIAVTKKRPYEVWEFTMHRGDTMYESGRLMAEMIIDQILADPDCKYLLKN